MERRRLPYAHPTTERFLVAAFKDGAHTPLIERARNNLELRRAIGAVAFYYTGNLSNRDVGNQLKVSKETARKLVAQGMAVIWDHASDVTKSAYPFGEIPLKKFGRPSKTMVSIIEAARDGQTHQGMLEETGLTSSDVAARRKELVKRGIEIPPQANLREERAKLIKICSDQTLPREDYLKIADDLSINTLRYLITYGAALSLTNALDAIGYYVGPKTIGPLKEFLIAEGLVLHRERLLDAGKNAGQVQHYYFAPTRDLGLIASRLAEEPKFDRYKQNVVRQIGGPKPEVHASSNDFVHPSSEFQLVSDILAPKGLTDRARHPKVPHAIFFGTVDCPVAIFEYGGKVIYYKKQREVLELFIDKRAQHFSF